MCDYEKSASECILYILLIYMKYRSMKYYLILIIHCSFRSCIYVHQSHAIILVMLQVNFTCDTNTDDVMPTSCKHDMNNDDIMPTWWECYVNTSDIMPTWFASHASTKVAG